MSAPSAEAKIVARIRQKNRRPSGCKHAPGRSPKLPAKGVFELKIRNPNSTRFHFQTGATKRENQASFRRPKALQTLMIRRAASSTSARVVETPKLKRSALEITAGSQPIATCTGDGSLDPLAHAAPAEQATPA